MTEQLHNKTKISNLLDKEFKVMIIKMLKELGRRTDEGSQKINNGRENKKNQAGLKNAIKIE